MFFCLFHSKNINSSHDPTTITNTSVKVNSSDKLDSKKKFKDPTQLLETISSTEVFGLVPLLYCLLLDPKNSRSVDTMTTLGVNVNSDSHQTTTNCIMPTSECSDNIGMLINKTVVFSWYANYGRQKRERENAIHVVRKFGHKPEEQIE